MVRVPLIRSRPTRDGWVAVALAFVLADVGAVGGNNLIVLVGCAGLAAVWVDLAAGRWNLRGVHVRWSLPGELFAEVPCRGAFVVENGRPRGDLHRIEVSDGVAAARADGVAPGEERAVWAWWRFARRGRFALDGIVVRSSWPFGLFTHTRTLPGEAEGVVWPRPASAHGREVPATDGDAGHADHADPTGDFRDLRPYRPGDRLRDIHGRTSARVGRPMVIVRSAERTGGVRATVRGDRPLEDELTRATGVILEASARGVPVGLELPGDPELARPTAGTRWRRRLLDALALAGPR